MNKSAAASACVPGGCESLGRLAEGYILSLSTHSLKAKGPSCEMRAARRAWYCVSPSRMWGVG